MSRTEVNDSTRSVPYRSRVSNARHFLIALSRQFGVFRFGLLEYRDVGVGVFPEGEEILVDPS